MNPLTWFRQLVHRKPGFAIELPPLAPPDDVHSRRVTFTKAPVPCWTVWLAERREPGLYIDTPDLAVAAETFLRRDRELQLLGL